MDLRRTVIINISRQEGRKIRKRCDRSNILLVVNDAFELRYAMIDHTKHAVKQRGGSFFRGTVTKLHRSLFFFVGRVGNDLNTKAPPELTGYEML